MKKLALAAALTVAATTASAQDAEENVTPTEPQGQPQITLNCIPYEALRQSWSEINTDSVFRGLSDQGVLTETFLNRSNGRYSTWIIPPTVPRMACQVDQGSRGTDAERPFTRTQNSGPVAPETSL